MTDSPPPVKTWARLTEQDGRWSEALAVWLERHPAQRRAAMLAAHSGDSPIWFVIVLLGWYWPALAAWRSVAGLALVGMLLAAAVVQIIKWSVRRPRPAGQWGQGYRRLDPHSFPSGHAARAVTLAAVAALCGPLPLAGLLVLWAPAVAFSRVGLRVHYLADIAVGAVCGLACGLAVVWWRADLQLILARF